MQASQSTAELPKRCGKSNWLTPREDLVQAKGKGMMQTFWVEPKYRITSLNNTAESTRSLAKDNFDAILGNKSQQLVDWSIDVLGCLLKGIITHRPMIHAENPIHAKRSHISVSRSQSKSDSFVKKLSSYLPTTVSIEAPILDKVVEIIDFPVYRESDQEIMDTNRAKIDDSVFQQLCSLVTEICNGYRENSFHNFEHMEL